MASALVNAVTHRKTLNPKTVLGFYATILGILFAGVVSVVGVLAASNVMVHLIPWLLVFSGATLLGLLVAVFILTLRDPSKLMLTQVTGTEYAVIQQRIVGDSAQGERVELIGPDGAVVEQRRLEVRGVPALAAGKTIEQPADAESGDTDSVAGKNAEANRDQ